MKKLIAVCLLAASATALAQSPDKDGKERARLEAQSAKDASRLEADEAKTRKELEEARQRLDQAARDVAELSNKLGARARHDIRIIEGGPRHAVLGIQIDDDPGKQGARVLSVSPGGPAAEAGLRGNDVIIALDGEDLPGTDADRVLVTKMRQVKPEQKVKVRVLRDGKKSDYVLVARPMDRMFNVRVPHMGPMGDMGAMGEVTGMGGGIHTAPFVQHFRFWPGEFAGLELATITPRLGAYFGVTDGVLVVQAPKEGAFKLEDGDVLQSIDGRKPDDGPHALRILRSYTSGEKLNLSVLRQRKPVTLTVTMPERPDMGDVFFHGAAPETAPLPPMPGVPPVPGTPGGRVTPEGAGSLD